MTTLSERTDLRRASIVEAAHRLLVRRGFQDVVLDEVAREAGVAKGTLFLYFKTKDELFSAAFGDLVDRLGAQLDDLASSGLEGEALLEATAATILTHFDRNADFLSQFSAGRFPSCGERSCGRLMEKFSGNIRRLASLLARATKRTGPHLAEPETSAVVLFGLCRSAFLLKRLTGRERSPQASTRWVVDQFLFGSRGRPR